MRGEVEEEDGRPLVDVKIFYKQSEATMGHNVTTTGLFYKEHNADAGFDLCVEREVRIQSKKTKLVELAFGLVIPKGYYGQIKCKSGLALNHKVYAFEGVVDSGYRGWIKVLLRNDNWCEAHFERGTKIAQMLILPSPAVRITPVVYEESMATKRGVGGFGSTGFFTALGAPVGAGGSGDTCWAKVKGEEVVMFGKPIEPDHSLHWLEGMSAQYSRKLKCMVARNGLPFVPCSSPSAKVIKTADAE